MDLAKYQGIIFDCDGVLIQSKQANKKFYNLILSKLSLPEMDSGQEDYVHCHTVPESLQYIVPEHLLARANQAAASISYKELIPYIDLQEGILEFLDCLTRNGVRCAVNTNRSHTMELILEQFDLYTYFSPVVTSLDVENPKPDPESVCYILNFWNADNRNVVFIGDSWVDEQTAISSGVEFWAYRNSDLTGATRNILDYRDISRDFEN